MQKIILTGATGGLGFQLAKKIVSSDIGKLYCVYRNKQKYQDMFDKEGLFPEGYLLEYKDDFSGLINLLDGDEHEAENIVLILNAFSIIPIASIGTFATEEIEEMIYGNITRNVLILNRIVEYCKKHNTGLRIINMDSGAADHPLTGWANYCASKAYLNSFLSVLAIENPDYEIVSFDPGVVDTDMQAKIRNTDKNIFNRVDTFIEYKERGVLRKPEDIADQIIDRYLLNWNPQSMREKAV